MIVVGNKPLDYVSRKLDFQPEGMVTAIGVERRGEIVAGAVFAFYTGYDIDVTIAAEPRCLTRGFMRAIGHYVFEQAGCIRASFMTEQPYVVTVGERLGLVIEGVKRNAYGPGRDGVMLGLLKEDWHGFEDPESTAAP